MNTRFLVAAVLITSSIVAMPQQQTPTSDRVAPTELGKHEAQIAAATIVFKRDETLPITPAEAGVWEGPLQCAGSRYYINLMLPPTFEKMQLNEVSKSKGIVRYSVSSARAFHDVQQMSFLPTDSGVIFLAQATTSDRKGRYAFRKPDGSVEERSAFAGERRFYLLRFDGNGIYRSAVELDKDLMITRIGMFDSGTYLALAMTLDDHQNHLAIFDTGGKLLRLFDLPKTLERVGQKEAKGIQGLSHSIVPWAQFLNWRGNILIVPHSKGTVFEVTAGGEIRSRTLKIPPDMEIDSFIPSGAHWYVRVGHPAKMNEAQYDPPKLFEFDPETGAILRQLQTENMTTGEIACEQEGEFVAFRWDEQKGLIAFRGTIN